ncbi:cupin domain-containing protein [Rhodococcus spelaei]|uniref:Cupin domain-containing protein n=1 Tax=Rhodococcus spelaei TaxID=2546320 RepID=A0A541B9F2_9NOCA|nr:cupin domain-containing protein [Rhodococcus spelaei]
MTTLTQLAASTAVAALVVLTPALVGAAAPAHATPSQGVTTETLGQVPLSGSVLPEPAGHSALPAQVTATLRRIVIAPGGTTGWHHHLGHVAGVVVSGTLTRQLDDCSWQTSPAGSMVSETPDSDHVGLNLGPEPVVLEVLYLLPEGAPFSTDAPAHCS